MITPATLTPAQQDVVDHYQALNVPASWFVGEADTDGGVEVVAVGVENHAWAFHIDADGKHHSAEAHLGDWETGISC